MQIQEEKQKPRKSKKSVQDSGFSKEAIDRKVVESSVRHPGVIIPAAVGIVGGIGLFFAGGLAWLATAAVIGISAGIAMLGVNLGLRRDELANRYIQELNRQLEEERKQQTRKLTRAMSELKSRKGLDQFNRLNNKFSTFQDILADKLDPSEFTHARYLGMAEQVYLSALDNLNSIILIKNSIKAIDIHYVENRIRQLRDSGSDHASITSEISSLEQRARLYYQQRENIGQLYSQNEEAMTRLDVAIAAVTSINTGNQRATMDLETAMNELERLSRRAADYSAVADN